jgi:GNAT superfamily N-acetyltransferase
MNTEKSDIITVPEQPSIAGLIFRRFRGEADYVDMVAILDGSREADQFEWTNSVEDMARSYRHLVNCDPYEDMLFVQVNGDVVGYSRAWWNQETEGTRLYQHFAFLLPAWRGKGIRQAMVGHNERRLREIAAEHPDDGPRFFQSGAYKSETHWVSLLTGVGYEAVRWGFEMIRPDLEGISDHPLPENVEIRPVKSEHYHIILAALNEAFQDDWGAMEWREEWLEEWMESPTFNPALWQVAWEGDEVAGTVLNYIDEEENEEYGRRRGYTEYISVRRPWRRQGLAKALIARSFHVLKEQGMTEAALGVDADNPNGALRLYKGMGFQPVKEWAVYRKPLA